MSIERLSESEARGIVKSRSSRAMRENNLSFVLGSNGKSGRSATGNYSLLAKATGLSRVHIGKVLRGQTGPSHETLCSLAEVTGLSLDEISDFIKTQAEKERAA